jgi:uncharacterized protein (TIGR02453 family)
MAVSKSGFSFKPALLEFLQELESNNNRDWFAENKSRYEQDVLEPALEFIAALETPFKNRVSSHFKVESRRSGGSLMRIYRDTRFSKDKTPYKTNVGIHIRHEMGKDVHAPGFYFHIDPREIFVGAGVWHPDNPALGKIRDAIVDEPQKWKRITNSKKLTGQFERRGDSLMRPPRDYDPDHPLIEDLKLKDHVLIAKLAVSQIRQKGIVDRTISLFAESKPFVRFLCDALRQPF